MTDTTNSQPVTITPDMAEMGIGTAEQGENLSRPNEPIYTQEQKDEAFRAELTRLTEGGEDVETVEQASQWGKDGEFTPATDANGANDPDGTAKVDNDKDDLPFEVPDAYNQPADQQTSPGDGAGGNDGGQAAATVTPPTIDMNEIVQAVYGQPVDEQTARAIFTFAKEMQNLTPQQAAQMQQVLQGQQIAPQPYYPQSQQQIQYNPQQPPVQPTYPQPYQPTPQPFNPQQPIQPPDWSQYKIPDEIDPDVAETIKPIIAGYQYQQQQLEAMQVQQQQANMVRMQQEQQAMERAAGDAITAWRAEKQRDQLLSDTEWVLLEQAALDSHLAPALLQQYGDPARAATETLEIVFSRDPKFQERVVAKRTADERARAAEQAKRTNTSSALAGGGGANTAAVNGNQQTQSGPPRQQTTDPNANMAGLIDGIAEWIANN